MTRYFRLPAEAAEVAQGMLKPLRPATVLSTHPLVCSSPFSLDFAKHEAEAAPSLAVGLSMLA